MTGPPSLTALDGVSFVIPVHNGEEWLDRVLESILAQRDERACEVIVVEDGSTDGSAAILARHGSAIRVVPGPGRGATGALNTGITHARYPIICQVDQDVILEPGWMNHLAARMSDPAIGAAQGYYVTPADGSIWSRAMGLDLEQRYRTLVDQDVDHVCTGNTAYRAEALREIGLFDESLGYGYDNDISYRLMEAGYRLVICPVARSVHRWRDDWRGYLVQQYGFGYGRLDLVAKHRRRFRGDDVSALVMMLHAPAMAIAVGAALVAAVAAAVSVSPVVPGAIAVSIVTALAAERLAAGISAWRRFGDVAGLWFVPVHLCRDLAWVAALAVWGMRRITGAVSRPSDSMYPRPARGLSNRRTR